MFETSDKETVDPVRRLIGTEGDTAGVFEQHPEHDASLKTGERSTDAEVNVAPECYVAARPLKEDFIGVHEHGGISIGGRPEQQDRSASRNVDIPERCALRDGTHVGPER